MVAHRNLVSSWHRTTRPGIQVYGSCKRIYACGAASDRPKCENKDANKPWVRRIPPSEVQSDSWYGGGTLSTGPQGDDFPGKASIPQGTASLESIVCPVELHQGSSLPPDYEKDNQALEALATTMVDPMSDILRTLADTILDITQYDSDGLSLLSKGGGRRLYWPAIADE